MGIRGRVLESDQEGVCFSEVDGHLALELRAERLLAILQEEPSDQYRTAEGD